MYLRSMLMSSLAFSNMCWTKLSEYMGLRLNIQYNTNEAIYSIINQIYLTSQKLPENNKDLIDVHEQKLYLCFYLSLNYFLQQLLIFNSNLIKLLLIRLAKKDLMKNQSALLSTGGPQLFHNPSLKTMRYEKKLPSYAHLPMNKDLPQWNVSSAVLRNSSILYTIPKDDRFKDPTINYFCHYELKYPSTLSNRATNFGYGKKTDIPKAFLHNKNIEGVGTPFYEVDDMVLRRTKSASIKKGKTIGVSWGSYATSRAPHRSTVHCPQQTRQNPGMKYEIADKTGGSVQKNKMHERLMMFTDIRGHDTLNQPGPQDYSINEKHVSKSSSKTNFGLGKKSDFTNNPELSSTPGPLYNIPGFCDKFMTNKIKNLGRGWK